MCMDMEGTCIVVAIVGVGVGMLVVFGIVGIDCGGGGGVG